MTHARKLIRDAAVAALSGHTAAGASVFSNRTISVWPTQLPAINVLTDEERAELFCESSREIKRVLKLIVEVIASDVDNETIDDTLDAIAEQVEAILAVDETFGGISDRCILAETGLFTRDGGAKPLAGLRMAFDVTYYTRPALATATDDFLTAHVTLEPDGATAATPTITDDITL